VLGIKQAIVHPSFQGRLNNNAFSRFIIFQTRNLEGGICRWPINKYHINHPGAPNRGHIFQLFDIRRSFWECGWQVLLFEAFFIFNNNSSNYSVLIE
jgi:hypothetical protein